jgi:3-phenylpropionate/trans-cinnamate dioxygenase ferredoxin reductase subunit
MTAPVSGAAGAGKRVVIVGGGQAAGAVQRKLRQLGFAGQVVLISDEAHAPYERPPLSKEYLCGSESTLRAIAPGRQANEQIRLECSAVRIDAEARTVLCGDGSSVCYDALVLATGGQPRRLEVPGSNLGRVHALRTASDSTALRLSIAACAKAGRPLLVVGGSWIGLEVAAAAREAGVVVVIAEAGERLCARTLPAASAHWLQTLHESKGVAIRLRTSLMALEGIGDVASAHLSDGSRLAVGAVVAGIGIVPETTLARQCGVLVRSGVVVDAHGRTNRPGIYAAGDVTEQNTRCHDGPVRVETWENANRQGEAVATDIVARLFAGGGEALPSVDAPAPWFWSDQYGVNLQVVGAPNQGDAHLACIDQPDKQLSLHLRGGRVVGAVAINSARELRRLRKRLDTGAPPTLAELVAEGFDIPQPMAA